MSWLVDLQGLSSLVTGQGGFVPTVLPALALFQPLFPQQPQAQVSGVSRRWGSPPCHPQSPLLSSHWAKRWHLRVSCFCPSGDAKGCGKPFFPAWQCPAPPSHNVCSSMQGGEAQAPGKELLLKKIYFPSISQYLHSRVRPVLSPPAPPNNELLSCAALRAK